MQEKAEEEGIDWYEIWPDLEDIEIFIHNPGFYNELASGTLPDA